MPDDATKEKTTLGPYIFGERRSGQTLEQIYALPQKARESTIQDIQSINIQSAAIDDSMSDDTIGEITLQLNGQKTTLENILEIGRNLPDAQKMELVRDVMNQNVTYTPPEVDPFVPRRETAPLQDIGDYAQTTRETLNSGIGDCEDWAIAQADMLNRMGIPPENLQVMSGNVYNTNDNTQFGHTNLAVKTSDDQWNVMELGNGKVFMTDEKYLNDGIEGYYFVPSISVGLDGKNNEFKLDHAPSGPTQKQRFTSSTSEYDLDDPSKPNISSELAFNRAAIGITPKSEPAMDVKDPALMAKVVQNAPYNTQTGQSVSPSPNI